MKNGFENIKELLSKYFEGNADDQERKRAEEYLIDHPEVMDKYEEIWSLRLHPVDESADFPGILLKAPAEFDDNQFLLLAAASEENDLSVEGWSDFEAILESSPHKKSIAAEFHNLKLKPLNDKWPGRNKMLRTTPLMSAIWKGVAVSLAAAAVLTAVLFLGPVKNDILQPTGQAVTLANKSNGQTKAIQKNPEDPASLIIARSITTTASAYITNEKTTVEILPVPENIVPEKEKVIDINNNPVLIPQLAFVEPSMAKVSLKIISTRIKIKEDYGNWMLNGLNAIASALGQERIPKDGLAVANEGVNEINKLLGWNMKLEQKTNENGDLMAVNFHSNLFSFSKPVKKNIEPQ